MAESTTVEVKKKRRGWVKDAAIIFLAVMLVLTFLSNTIMNWSLPEVSGQYAGYGTISTAIRGTGSVTANRAYSVQISETRQIKSVLVKVGDMVQAGQVLFELEDAESDELQALIAELETMKINYQIKILQNMPDDYVDAINDINDMKNDLAKRNQTEAKRATRRSMMGKSFRGDGPGSGRRSEQSDDDAKSDRRYQLGVASESHNLRTRRAACSTKPLLRRRRRLSHTGNPRSKDQADQAWRIRIDPPSDHILPREYISISRCC